MVLDRYIAKTVIVGALLSVSVFAAIFVFIDFVGELEDVGKHNYGVLQALWYVLLSAPQRLYELSPPAILLGGLISLGAMATNLELVAIRAAGVTLTRFIRSVLQAGAVLAISIFILGEYVVPYATSSANAMRAVALEEKVLAGGKGGFWAIDENRYIGVKQVLPDYQLDHVTVHELNAERELVRSTVADSADYSNGVWHLSNVRHSDIKDDQIIVSQNQSENWERLLEPELFDVLRLQPINMSAQKLYQYSTYMQDNNLDSSSYRLAFWIKLFTPLTCLAMLLIATPIVLSSSPRSGGTGQRIFIGLMLGTAFFVLNRAINHLGIVYGLIPFVSAILPLMILIVISVILMRKI